MALIHKTALVDDRAQLAEDVEVGPFSIIGPEIKIGAGSKIGPYVQLKNKIEMGEKNVIYHGACLGEFGQDLTFNNPEPKMVIGNNNVIRENVVIHQPSKSGNTTRIGDNNYIMCNAHLGHDVVMGNNNIIASSTAIGGYVELQNNVFISGLVGVHQFVHLGSYCLVSAGTPTLMDVPPYSVLAGSPGMVTGLNIVGMRRAKFSPEKIQLIKNIYKIVFMRGHAPAKAYSEIENKLLGKYKEDTDEYAVVMNYINFLKSSKRGVAPRQA